MICILVRGNKKFTNNFMISQSRESAEIFDVYIILDRNIHSNLLNKQTCIDHK